MKIFSWNEILGFLNTGVQNSFFDGGVGISVGCFDGIHKGHRELLGQLVDGSKKAGLKSGVVSFSRPLPSIKHSGDYSGDISSLDCRLKIFESLGIDFVIIVDFDDEFASQLGADFLNILVNACNMELLAEGVDFHCGYKGATDIQAIKYFGEKNKVKTVFVEPVYYMEGTDEEQRISSSYIREMVNKGFFSTVAELLNRPYEIDLNNYKFEKSGKNIVLKKDDFLQALPPSGVYRVSDKSGNEYRLKIDDIKFSLQCVDCSQNEDFPKRLLFK